MRIFEVTQVTEIAPGSFGAKAGVFGRAFGTSLLNRIAPGSTTGSNFTGSTIGAPNRSMAAANLTMSAAPKLASDGMLAWSQTLSQMMANARPPVLSAGALESGDIDKAAWDMIDQYLARGYNSLQKDTTPQGKEAFANLKRSHDDLVTATQTGDNNQIKQAWTDLARDIILAQNAETFSYGAGSVTGTQPKVALNRAGQLTINGEIANKNDPDHLPIIQNYVQAFGQLKL